VKLKAIKDDYMKISNERFVTKDKVYDVVHNDGKWIGIIDDRNEFHYFAAIADHEGYFGNWFEVV
jgi:hypothetical protein